MARLAGLMAGDDQNFFSVLFTLLLVTPLLVTRFVFLIRFFVRIRIFGFDHLRRISVQFCFQVLAQAAGTR